MAYNLSLYDRSCCSYLHCVFFFTTRRIFPGYPRVVLFSDLSKPYNLKFLCFMKEIRNFLWCDKLFIRTAAFRKLNCSSLRNRTNFRAFTQTSHVTLYGVNYDCDKLKFTRSNPDSFT